MTDKARKPGFLEQISYASGDFGFNLYWTTISAFLLIFYTDSFGLAPKAAGTMLLVTKIVDAFADPIIGGLADRTRSRWGRFRPWILYGALPLAASAVITFTTPDLDSTAKLIYAYATFTLMMICYSAANIPYGALSGVLTSDSRARTLLNSLRFVGGFLGGLCVTYLTPRIRDYFTVLHHGDKVFGWQMAMLASGLVACIIFVILFLSTRERVEPIAEKPASPWRDIGDLMQNRPWLIMFGLSLTVMITISTRLGASSYYLKYYMVDAGDTALFTPLYLCALAVGSLLTPLLTRFIDKRNLMIVLMILVGVLCVAFYFVPRDQITLIYGLHIAIGLCLGPKSPLTFAMYADSADYNEFSTGRRATGMAFAAASFSQKLGGAIASAVIGWVLASLGYVANQAQGNASQWGIVMLMSLVPGGIALLAAGLMLLYNLSDARMKDIQAELESRKADKT